MLQEILIHKMQLQIFLTKSINAYRLTASQIRTASRKYFTCPRYSAQSFPLQREYAGPFEIKIRDQSRSSETTDARLLISGVRDDRGKTFAYRASADRQRFSQFARICLAQRAICGRTGRNSCRTRGLRRRVRDENGDLIYTNCTKNIIAGSKCLEQTPSCGVKKKMQFKKSTVPAYVVQS